MPVYRIDSEQQVTQLKSRTFPLERTLQQLVEQNLETLLGVRFIATEFTTGDRQRGRIDSVGLDQDGTPTIIEYKKTSKENVINQGLFYLDWLMDHKGDFTLAAQQALKGQVSIDWSNPRLILVAESFSKYDEYAVNRIGANIELWIYRLYGENLLYLEQIYASVAPKLHVSTTGQERITGKDEIEPVTYTVKEHLQDKPNSTVKLFEQLRERVLDLGDGDIVEKPVKNYISYKHGKNFCEVCIQTRRLKIWLDILPSDLEDPFELGRDMTTTGHWGTGDVEVLLESPEQLEAVMALIEQSYQQTV
jgi:predicted transport protein